MSSTPRTESAAVTDFGRTRLTSQLLHDLRSPLNLIIGYSEMLIEEGQGPSVNALVADLEKIGAAGHLILRLLEENFISLEGSSVAVELKDEEKRSWRERSPADLQPASAPGLILVVDDDAVNRDVLSRRLIRQGHEVRSASSGEEALGVVRQSAFDLVLLDIMMPDMDGYEVLSRLKADERLQAIPVIMVSALSEVESVVRCIDAGAEDYLTKPFNATLLRARIGACLERKRGRDRESVLFGQLQENYKQLQAVEKLRDDMRNMIVHDLRTPLSAMILGVSMLEKHGDLNETQREMMAIASGGGLTLLGMINDLLDVEKMESGGMQLNLEPLAAAALVAGAVEQVASLVEEGRIAVVTEIASGLPDFSGDQNLLSRTLVNLIANAIKFTRGGTVTISASQANAGTIRFAVRDTGAGIPAEAFDRIFEKFGQLDSQNKVGTGLGLTFCKLAVEAHGGHIDVESTPGEGSTFSFTIPLAARGQSAP